MPSKKSKSPSQATVAPAALPLPDVAPRKAKPPQGGGKPAAKKASGRASAKAVQGSAAKKAAKPAKTPSRREETVIHDMPDRFQFLARGASMEVVDTSTGRRSAFPKASTGVVQRVLGALFSEAAQGGGQAASWADALPPGWENEDLGLRLTHVRVAVAPAHPNVVLGSPEDHPEGHVVHAYEITLGGRHIGHVLAHAKERFVLIAPSLQTKATQHRGFVPVTLRLEVLAEGQVEGRSLASA